MEICKCGNPYTPASTGNGKTMCKTCVTNRRRFEKKKLAVDYLGGKCVDCGYDRCIEALEFDHVDPNSKEFTISGNHCLSWDRIKAELDKCQLRCANCHRERHANEKSNTGTYIVTNSITQSVCPSCSNTFSHLKSDKRKFCSASCYGNSTNKIVWPELDELIDLVRSTSFLQASSLLGVTDNAIRKRLAKYGVNPKEIRNIHNNKFTRQ